MEIRSHEPQQKEESRVSERRVIVSEETARVLSTEHANAERFLQNWFDGQR